MKQRSLSEVLKEDMKALKKMYQPKLVSEQLNMLYKEFDEKNEKPNSLLDDTGSSFSRIASR